VDRDGSSVFAGSSAFYPTSDSGMISCWRYVVSNYSLRHNLPCVSRLFRTCFGAPKDLLYILGINFRLSTERTRPKALSQRGILALAMRSNKVRRGMGFRGITLNWEPRVAECTAEENHTVRTIIKTVVSSMAVFMALVGIQRSAAAAENSIPGVTYMDSQRVLDNFDKKNANPLIPGDVYNVQTNKRVANGNIEIHEKETDIFYIMDGSATIVVGGTALEPKQTRPGQMTAKDIQGGQLYQLKKGDVLVIPAGTPHWFKQVNGSINYLTVKSIKP
jgi:mannose-6-phosphate isomerase-like protein (cupin superfamily)